MIYFVSNAENKTVYRGADYDKALRIYDKHCAIANELPQEERFRKSPVTLLKIEGIA